MKTHIQWVVIALLLTTVLPGAGHATLAAPVSIVDKSEPVTALAAAASGDMALIPAGEFQMGCDPDHNGGEECQYWELPLHTVYLDAYNIDRTEVTNAQCGRCVAAGTCSASEYNNDEDLNAAEQPVVGVSWRDAAAYCGWVGEGGYG